VRWRAIGQERDRAVGQALHAAAPRAAERGLRLLDDVFVRLEGGSKMAAISRKLPDN
jgi:hypothetical protein